MEHINFPNSEALWESLETPSESSKILLTPNYQWPRKDQILSQRSEPREKAEKTLSLL